MKNYTEGIEPLNYDWGKFSGGFKQGQIAVYAASRQTGKSVWNNLCAEILDTENNWDSIIRDYSIQWSPDIPKSQSPYKFSRNWHVAEFDEKDYFKVKAWCSQQFGPHPARPDAWSRWWHKSEHSILFRDEEDFVLFMLRWS